MTIQKTIYRSVYYIILITLCAYLWACGGGTNVAPPSENTPTIPSTDATTPLPDSVLIKNKAANIIRILKAADWRTLSTHVHPVNGLRFSPYSSINEDNLVFKKEELSAIDTQKIYVWGAFDGSGSPIRYTAPRYHKEFIYDLDFMLAEKIIYNKFAQYGNTYNTIQKMYPESINVEYYISGEDPQFKGFDWRVLRLVYTKHEKKWYLTAIIHSQFTT